MHSFRAASFLLLAVAPGLGAQTLGSGAGQAEPLAMHHEHAATQPSTTLALSGRGQRLALDAAALQAMPQTTVSVFNAHSKQQEGYTGPLVSDVLAKLGLLLNEKTQHEVLDSYVVATGTDGYFVIFSGAELQPALHKTQAIVALTRAGQPLGRNGAFQLIDPADVKPARWVRNLCALTIVPVPAPDVP